MYVPTLYNVGKVQFITVGYGKSILSFSQNLLRPTIADIFKSYFIFIILMKKFGF